MNQGIFYLFSLLIAATILSCSSSSSKNIGNEAFKKGDFSSAIIAYSESLKTNPKDVNLLFGRGRAYQELEKFFEAQQDFEKALNLEPKNFQILLSIASIQLDQKNYANALLYATKAEEIPGAPAVSSLLKGRALHLLGMPEAALKAYGHAIQVDKNFGQAYLHRGLLKVALKRNKEACEDFKLATALDYPRGKEILQKYCK
ncbi:MAG: tetratricopeptide repeat protein [Bacteroidetes bacterium]|nr:tetratricopeptide repeat protein [Bacteroidota bacterium]